MTTLTTNRYGVVTPTAIQENGCAISVPFYISPTSDQSKQLLNAFRGIKQKQLIELGYETTQHNGFSGITVETATKPPQTPIEQELGMDEEALRYVLFGRQGIQERLLIKLMRLTGVYLITREQVEETYKQWLDNLYGDERQATSRATKVTAPTKKVSRSKTVSVSA